MSGAVDRTTKCMLASISMTMHMYLWLQLFSLPQLERCSCRWLSWCTSYFTTKDTLVGPGEATRIEQETLDKNLIAEQCSPQACIVEMFDYCSWLRSCVEKPTWKDVAEVLKAICLIKLGLDIERVHITGTL